MVTAILCPASSVMFSASEQRILKQIMLVIYNKMLEYFIDSFFSYLFVEMSQILLFYYNILGSYKRFFYCSFILPSMQILNSGRLASSVVSICAGRITTQSG